MTDQWSRVTLTTATWLTTSQESLWPQLHDSRTTRPNLIQLNHVSSQLVTYISGLQFVGVTYRPGAWPAARGSVLPLSSTKELVVGSLLQPSLLPSVGECKCTGCLINTVWVHLIMELCPDWLSNTNWAAGVLSHQPAMANHDCTSPVGAFTAPPNSTTSNWQWNTEPMHQLNWVRLGWVGLGWVRSGWVGLSLWYVACTETCPLPVISHVLYPCHTHSPP